MYPINYTHPYPVYPNILEYPESRLGQSGMSTSLSFPPALIQKYFALKGNPAAIQQEMAKPKNYAAGCEGRPTLIITINPFLKVPNVFLMLVISSDPFGYTTGVLFPTGTFGKFPTSSIIYYDCAF